MTDYRFISALPVWAKGRETEMNLWLGFSVVTKKYKSVLLALTGSSAYSVRVNGEFFAFGPARCAHGFYRVDELDISDALREGENNVMINVAGYNVNSYYLLDQSSFLCAELICDGKVTAATGSGGFFCREISEHEEKAERYSFQRTFTEIYNIGAPELSSPELTVTEEKHFIARGSGYTHYERKKAEKLAYRGPFVMEDHRFDIKYPRHIITTDETYKLYKLDEVKTNLHLLARNFCATEMLACEEPAENVRIDAGNYAAFKMNCDTSGMISLKVSAKKPAQILIRFDEVLRDGTWLDFRRLGMTNAMLWRIPAGEYTLETFEPYTLGYAQVIALDSDITVCDFKMICFGADKPERTLCSDDPKLRAVFDAAVETYRQNTFTIYMDCPSRERAGWLCDSFFTARSEHTLTGKNDVERVFLENFLIPDSFRALPDGMLPMCYPADHYNGNFIPNWAMWYVIELEEYFARTGDSDLIAQAKDRVYRLAGYFKGFENEFGLLESLQKWVFIEWSEANNLTQDVNFPTNMLYAKMLRSIASIYGDKAQSEKADALEKTINRMSRCENGFYCDNAIRGDDRKLHLSGKCTETCQYYAFFCGTATPESNPLLWNTLLSDFGPERDFGKTYPEIYPSNAFIGFNLRLELLYRFGEHKRLLENIKGYFYGMASLTGTLWEGADSGSCNHGFASHVVYWLDGLGLLSLKRPSFFEKKEGKETSIVFQ